jgi:hypothetical protein
MAPTNNNNRWNVNNNKPVLRFNSPATLTEKNSQPQQNICSEWINKSPHLPAENSSHAWQHKLSLKTRIGPKSFVMRGAKTKKIKWIGGKKTEVCGRKRMTRKQRK